MEEIKIPPRALNNEDMHIAFLEKIEQLFDRKIEYIIQVGFLLKVKFKEA